MAINITDFDKIWASTSPLTPYSFTDANYQEGWNFIGSTPPARQMWDYLQKNNDEKAQFLSDAMFKGNPLTFTADDGNGNTVSLVGDPNGSITWNGKDVERVNASGTGYIRYESGLQICWGRYNISGSSNPTEQNITYSVPFLDTVYPSIGNDSRGQTSIKVYHSNDSSTGFTVTAIGMTSGSASGGWVAIGYWK